MVRCPCLSSLFSAVLYYCLLLFVVVDDLVRVLLWLFVVYVCCLCLLVLVAMCVDGCGLHVFDCWCLMLIVGVVVNCRVALRVACCWCG